MLSESQFNLVVVAWIVLALALVPIQLRVTAPYGRHMRPGWGPTIPARFGWMAMEGVSLALFAWLFVAGPAAKSAAMWLFFVLWVAHYTNRTLIFPFRVRPRPMPLVIVASGVGFNAVNAGLNGFYLGTLSPPYANAWLTDPRCLIGLAVFFVGMAINLTSDDTLFALRQPGAPDYTIPKGGLFRLVSCPNHFGEMVEWTGFAIACWNLPAASFAIWTAANLIPRSLSHHRWYRQRFPDYPPERKAVIPFVL